MSRRYALQKKLAHPSVMSGARVAMLADRNTWIQGGWATWSTVWNALSVCMPFSMPDPPTGAKRLNS
jgi:hypothetical protein